MNHPRAQQSYPAVVPSPPVKPYPGTVGAAIQDLDAARTRESTAVDQRTARATALQRAHDDNIVAAHNLHQLQQAHAE